MPPLCFLLPEVLKLLPKISNISAPQLFAMKTSHGMHIIWFWEGHY
jgi:hypothetical protein